MKEPSRLSMTLLGFAALLAFTLPAQLRPANFLPDDTYYYLQVAHNIMQGEGSTFNGIMPTNGYHPLWMLFCVGGMFISGGNKELAIHIILAVQALLFFPIIATFTALSARADLRYGPLAYPILALYFLTGLYGSEAHLNALTSLLALFYLYRAIGSEAGGEAGPEAASKGASPGSALDWALTGLFLGLSILARLDNLFLAAMVLALSVVMRPRSLRDASRRGGMLRELLLTALPAAIVVLPYLLWNRANFGHLMPVSGAIKSSFPEVTFSIGRLALLGKIVALFALAGVGLSFRADTTPRQRLLLRVLGGATLLHALYIACFLEYGAGWSWYYVIGVLDLCFVLAMLLDLWFGRKREAEDAPPVLVILFAGLLLVAGVARSWYKMFDPYFAHKDALFRSVESAGSDPRPELARWMKAHLPAGSGVLAEDGAGAIAYYSDLRVIPLDGLVADYDYNDELLRLGAASYLASHGIDYFVGTVDPRGAAEQSVRVVAPLYRRDAGTITLRRDALLTSAKDGARPFDVGVWKMGVEGKR